MKELQGFIKEALQVATNRDHLQDCIMCCMYRERDMDLVALVQVWDQE